MRMRAVALAVRSARSTLGHRARVAGTRVASVSTSAAASAASPGRKSVGEVLGTSVAPAKDGDKDEYVSLEPDTCCGTVPLHNRQVVLLTPEAASTWPSRPEAEKGSLAWRYARLLRSAAKSGRDVAGESSGSGGACGIGPAGATEDGEDDADVNDRETAPVVKLLQAHMRGAGDFDERFSFLDSSAAYAAGERHALMIFPEAVLVSDLTPRDAAAVVASLEKPAGGVRASLRKHLGAVGSAARVEQAPGLHFLVCCHSRRDKRCGDNGATVVSWLRKWRSQHLRAVGTSAFQWRTERERKEARAGQADGGGAGPVASGSFVPSPRGGREALRFGVPPRHVIHVWPVSHVGLHRMAANVIVNPPGDWFAHMHEHDDARRLFDHALTLGLDAVPPDADDYHPLRLGGASPEALGLPSSGWDAPVGRGASAEGATPDERAAAWADDTYSSLTVRRAIGPVARWWRGRTGLSKAEQQRVFLEISPGADLGHAKLSAQLMGGSDRH